MNPNTRRVDSGSQFFIFTPRHAAHSLFSVPPLHEPPHSLSSPHFPSPLFFFFLLEPSPHLGKRRTTGRANRARLDKNKRQFCLDLSVTFNPTSSTCFLSVCSTRRASFPFLSIHGFSCSDNKSERGPSMYYALINCEIWGYFASITRFLSD